MANPTKNYTMEFADQVFVEPAGTTLLPPVRHEFTFVDMTGVAVGTVVNVPYDKDQATLPPITLSGPPGMQVRPRGRSANANNETVGTVLLGPVITLPAEVTTTAPPVTTTPPPLTTTAPPVTTTAPPVTTTRPPVVTTTVPPVTTTLPPVPPVVDAEYELVKVSVNPLRVTLRKIK